MKRTGPSTNPWATSLITVCLLDLSPFTTKFWALPSSQFFSQLRVYLFKPWAASFTRKLSYTFSNYTIYPPDKNRSNQSRLFYFTTFFTLVEKWLSGEVPCDWRMGIVTHIFKMIRKEEWGIYKLVSFTPFLGEIMEQILLKAVLRHMQNKEIVRNSQHNFNKSKL